MGRTDKQINSSAEELDKVFDIAIVLLGVLAAAEFQYISGLSGVSSQLERATFIITTLPFIVLIIAWILNKLVIRMTEHKIIEYTIRIFCWVLWGGTLFIFLGLFGVLATDITTTPPLCPLIIAGGIGSIFMNIAPRAYRKIYSEEDYLPKTNWHIPHFIGTISALIAFASIGWLTLTTLIP